MDIESWIHGVTDDLPRSFYQRGDRVITPLGALGTVDRMTMVVWVRMDIDRQVLAFTTGELRLSL